MPFIGVPDASWTQHHSFVMRMAEATGHGLADPDTPVPPDLFGEIMPYLLALIVDRREHPGRDVTTGIVHGEIDGQPISDGDLVNMIITIMLAGHITTTSTIGESRPASCPASGVEKAGVVVLSSCSEGTCGTCKTPVLEGEPDHRDSVLEDDEKQANDCMMICVSRSCTPRLVLDL